MHRERVLVVHVKAKMRQHFKTFEERLDESMTKIEMKIDKNMDHVVRRWRRVWLRWTDS